MHVRRTTLALAAGKRVTDESMLLPLQHVSVCLNDIYKLVDAETGLRSCYQAMYLNVRVAPATERVVSSLHSDTQHK